MWLLRNKKRAECVVELYRHAGIFKNNARGTSFFYFFYKMYRELRTLEPMTQAACIISQQCIRVT